MKKPLVLTFLAALLALGLLAGCGDSDSDSGGETTTAAACEPGQLETVSDGTLTVAYAIAKRLGYPAAKVKWTIEPFNSSYAPGPKDFDFDVNQISITPVREKAVDFSAPYYTANQAVVALKDSGAAAATSLADLQDAQLGVQIGTTSLDAAEAEIDPSSQPQVFNSSNDVVTALKNETIDAVVVDLPTALYITAAQVPSATVVGQFPAPGGDRWGALLAKDSPLTACVSDAIDELRSSGELERLTQRWMSQAAGAPLLR